MDKTISIISKNLKKHSHFEEYSKIIDIIKSNENINPDICIESCKALVEGISKTILIDLDNTRNTENIDKDELPKLFKDAMRVLSDNCKDIEGDFASRFSAIMQVIGEIRNKRGDISHGRMAPKFIFSSAKLASTVVTMTDSMLEYILEHYFSIEVSESSLDFESEKMEKYNEWLDSSLDFPIKKARYSKLLFENDYDEYETRYKDEYLTTLELEPELKDGINVVLELLRINSSKKIETIEKQIKFEFEKAKEDIKIEQEDLVNTFNEAEFWTKDRKRMLIEFARENQLNLEGLVKITENYLAFDVEPLRDDIGKIMKNPPSLADRRTVLQVMMEDVINFAEKLKK